MYLFECLVVTFSSHLESSVLCSYVLYHYIVNLVFIQIVFGLVFFVCLLNSFPNQGMLV